MARRRRPPGSFGGGSRRRGTGRRRTAGRRGPGMVQERIGPPVGGEVELPEELGVQELATRLGLSGVEVIKQLMREGVMANLTQMVDYRTAALVATDLGFQPRGASTAVAEPTVAEPTVAEPAQVEEDGALVTRPPVVTILGHVDHGKTTLLDTIRQSKVAAGESGGITQHIGAYQVELPATSSGQAAGKRITFLDTPGHEAFTAMRARGARVTDIAVLVVAADDGVMPQTVEAIDHARAAGVAIVVAINKIDQPDADVERVKRQLLERELVLEELGGEVIAVPVSAKTGEGMQELLENLLVVAEVADLKADPERLATGVVIEAKVDRAKGPLATVLIQNGTLRLGQPIVVGEAWGRVKAMQDHAGRRVLAAGPAQPVEVLGLDRPPRAGDPMQAFAEDRAARSYVEEQQRQRRPTHDGPPAAVVRAPSLEEEAGGKLQELPVIVKTDVHGSVEPVRESMEGLATEGAMVRVLHAGAGSINESDVLLAIASKAMIIGFNTEPEPGARSLAQTEGVEIRSYQVIYTLLDEVRLLLEGVLEPVQREVIEGHAEVRSVFAVGRRMRIAGLYMTDGRAGRNSRARVLRDGKLHFEGAVSTLKRFKEDVREVTAGLECGLTIDAFADFQEADAIEFFRSELTKPS